MTIPKTTSPPPTWTVFQITARNLRHVYVALVLTFLLPLVFFSIFASIFGSMGGGSDGIAKIGVVGVDQDLGEASQRLLAALAEEGSLNLRIAPPATDEDPSPQPYDIEDARRLVRAGRFAAAVILPKGFSESFGDFTGTGQPVELLYDAANPIARHTLTGLLQAAAMRSAPDLMMTRGLEDLEAASGPLSQLQRDAVETFRRQLLASDTEGAGGSAGRSNSAEDHSAGSRGFGSGIVPVQPIDVRTLDTDTETSAPKRSMVAYYAAGISVMFLLFSMSGAAGSLLDEEESGVLERLLSTRATMSSLLAGKWLFYGLMGFLQVLLMFGWGALFFGLDITTPKRLIGLVVMALFTALAAAGFGLVLATICRTRGQLSGVSTVAIMLMSAIGGSMFPRFMMPELMNKASLLTFNGWALDGFLKIFWYDDPTAGLTSALLDLLPQLAMLMAMTVAFLALARYFSRRWELA